MAGDNARVAIVGGVLEDEVLDPLGHLVLAFRVLGKLRDRGVQLVAREQLGRCLGVRRVGGPELAGKEPEDVAHLIPPSILLRLDVGREAGEILPPAELFPVRQLRLEDVVPLGRR